MRIKLLKPKDMNGFGKILPIGQEMEVLEPLGYAMIDAGEAKNLDIPSYGFVIKPEQKIGTKKIHTRKLKEDGE